MFFLRKLVNKISKDEKSRRVTRRHEENYIFENEEII